MSPVSGAPRQETDLPPTSAGPRVRSAPDHRRNGSLAAASAIVGAIVGGTLSFAGTYFASEAQARQHDFEVRRDAYVEFFSESQKYRTRLLDWKRAAATGDQVRYTETLDQVADQGASFYAATAGAALVTDRGDEVWQAYWEYIDNGDAATDIADYDEDRVETAIHDGDAAVNELVGIARQEIKGDVSG